MFVFALRPAEFVLLTENEKKKQTNKQKLKIFNLQCTKLKTDLQATKMGTKKDRK